MESNRRGLGINLKASSNGNQYPEGLKATSNSEIFGMSQLRKKSRRLIFYLLAFGVSFFLGIFMVRGLLGGLTVHQNAVIGGERGVLGLERETSLPPGVQVGSYLSSIGEILGGVNAPEGFYLLPEDLYPVEVSLKDASAKVSDLISANNRNSLKPKLLPIFEDKQEKLLGSNDTETGWSNVTELVFSRNIVEIENSPKVELFPSGKLNRPRFKMERRSTDVDQCVNFTIPFGEYERVGDSQERGQWLGTDFRSVLLDNKVPEWCPELVVNRAGIGPEILQDPNGYNMNEDFSSSWDGWVPGFNKKPFEEDIDLLFPNPISVGQVKISYFPVGKSELWISMMASIMRGEDPNLPVFLRTNETSEKIKTPQLYDALIFSFGTWFGNLLSVPTKYSEDDQIAGEVRRIINFLKCPKGRNRWCIGPFKGRMVYRSNTGRFDRENFCARPEAGADLASGKACSINSVVSKMIRKDFKTGIDGDLLFLDALNITFSRPDRSIDGMVFYPHKCVVKGVPCTSETKEVQDCCWEPNLFPHVGSLTLTHMLVNMLWDDPLIFGSEDGTRKELKEGSTTRKSRRLLSSEAVLIKRVNPTLILKKRDSTKISMKSMTPKNDPGGNLEDGSRKVKNLTYVVKDYHSRGHRRKRFT